MSAKTPPADQALATALRSEALSSGKLATVEREAIGRDMEKAAAILGTEHMSNPISMGLALFAQIGSVDGVPMVYEELREMSMNDVASVMGLVNPSGSAKPHP